MCYRIIYIILYAMRMFVALSRTRGVSRWVTYSDYWVKWHFNFARLYKNVVILVVILLYIIMVRCIYTNRMYNIKYAVGCRSRSCAATIIEIGEDQIYYCTVHTDWRLMQFPVRNSIAFFIHHSCRYERQLF